MASIPRKHLQNPGSRRQKTCLSDAPATPPPQKARKHLTVTEWRRLLDAARAAGPRDLALVLVLYEGALRASEAGMLRLSYLDLPHRKLYVHRGKGSAAGWVDLSQHTVDALDAWVGEVYPSTFIFPGGRVRGRPARGLCGRAVNLVFHRLAEVAQLHPKLSHPHVLKHSRIQHLLDAMTKETGNPWAALQVIAKLVGHQAAETTIKHYATATARELGIARDITDKLTS